MSTVRRQSRSLFWTTGRSFSTKIVYSSYADGNALSFRGLDCGRPTVGLPRIPSPLSHRHRPGISFSRGNHIRVYGRGVFRQTVVQSKVFSINKLKKFAICPDPNDFCCQPSYSGKIPIVVSVDRLPSLEVVRPAGRAQPSQVNQPPVATAYRKPFHYPVADAMTKYAVRLILNLLPCEWFI